MPTSAPAQSNIVTLQSAQGLRKGDFEVDREAGVLRNISVIARGPALGHGFDVDDVMLSQVESSIKKKGAVGVKSRITHPGPGFFDKGTDPIEVMIGRLSNVRIEDHKVRGDLHIANYASHSPRGNLREYILSIAEEDPSIVGLSIAFIPDEFETRTDDQDQTLPPAGRLKEVIAVDVVGDPAANPDGMLSQTTTPTTGTTTEPAAMPGKSTPANVPADPAGLNVDPTTAVAATPATPAAEPVALATPAPAATASAPDAGATALAAENQRVSEIIAIGELAGLPESWALGHIRETKTTVADARADALAKKAETGGRQTAIRVGENQALSTLRPAMVDAIMLRAGEVSVETPHERAREFRGLSVVDMYRNFLSQLGVNDAINLSRTRLVELMGPREFRRSYPRAFELAQSTSDFDNIIIDVQNKTLRQAYIDAPATWNRWARRATAPDFKNVNRTSLSESPDLVSRNEGGEIKYLSLGDGKETYAVVEYTGGIKLTRRAIVNDDMDAFGRIPVLQANAARRKEDDVAYAVLTDNANMADGTALFAAGHSNVVASGAAPSVAQLEATHKLLRLQKGPKSAARLNLRAKFAIVPVALEVTMSQLIDSKVDPSKSNDTPNPFRSKFEVVADPRLDDDSALKYYLAADPAQIDTVEVAFLTDEPEPVLKQETDFDTDDMKFAVRHTTAAAAIDHRGLARNAGA